MAKQISKPYPNYHAARLMNPGLFVQIRVLNTSPEGIMFYGGRLKTDPRGSSKTQAIRFPKDKFTAAQAKAWLKSHNHKPILFEPATGAKKQKAVWTTRYINDLPDSSFLYIEPGGKKEEGKTKPRTLRHFPYKDTSGKIDLPHLRNAIARIPQSSLSANLKTTLQNKAKKILEAQKKEKRTEPLWPSISGNTVNEKN